MKKMNSSKKYTLVAYGFLLPYIVITLGFYLYPLVYSVVLAFFQTNGPKSRVFIGLDNFLFILKDEFFYKALWNTIVFASFSIFLQLPLSLGLALLLNESKSKIKNVFRFFIFSPQLVGQIFVGIMFTVLLVPRYGLFNQFIHSLFGWGLENQWLENPALVMPAIVIAALWMYIGFNMIYFLAALQNVPESLIEAAKIDGANAWYRFLNVTLPAIKPVMVFVVVMSIIGSFQLFELPYALLISSSGAGPNESGLTIVTYMYNHAFSGGDLGLGSAIGWILTMIIFAFSLIQLRIMRST